MTTESHPASDATNDSSSSQPVCKRQRTYGIYTFYRYEDVEEKWLSVTKELAPETLCWVQQSRGKKRNNTAQLVSRARVVGPEQEYEVKTGSELRVKVRYPSGSTYHAKRMHLLPVLREEQVVVVCPETNLYRRWAKIHTQAEDHFVEIGCDMGILVNMIQQHTSCPQHVWGLDKSEGDIVEAEKRYPDCNFRSWNVPLEAAMKKENEAGNDNGKEQAPYTWKSPPLPTDFFPPIDKDAAMNPSLVVAIDINGTRQLKAVQTCIEIVIQEWKPRLIVVKSRTLYADLAGESVEETDDTSGELNDGSE